MCHCYSASLGVNACKICSVLERNFRMGHSFVPPQSLVLYFSCVLASRFCFCCKNCSWWEISEAGFVVWTWVLCSLNICRVLQRSVLVRFVQVCLGLFVICFWWEMSKESCVVWTLVLLSPVEMKSVLVNFMQAPPESTPKHVAFDLQRNSSQGGFLWQFVLVQSKMIDARSSGKSICAPSCLTNILWLLRSKFLHPCSNTVFYKNSFFPLAIELWDSIRPHAAAVDSPGPSDPIYSSIEMFLFGLDKVCKVCPWRPVWMLCKVEDNNLCQWDLCGCVATLLKIIICASGTFVAVLQPSWR